MATNAQRAHGRALMDWWIKNEPSLGYSQGPRRMELTKLTEQQTVTAVTAGAGFLADCSGFATAIHKWAGLADPNGQGYDGTGFTGTMLDHLPHYTDPKGANTLALVVFRRPEKPTGDHVAIVLEPGADPWLCSHGQNSGPVKIKLSTELAAQRRFHGSSSQAVFLNVSAQ